MPDPALRRLLHRHAFERKSGGRDKGQEDVEAHQRKGVAGDWKNHFTERVTGKFAEETGDLVNFLGYEEEGD
jgi:lipopolysaccharide transport system ATP-binding protein